MTQTEIKVKGAREHNLRDVSLTLRRGELICFSGVSGSGKSSLAFDTLYAEGQRRYVESLSNYARQFMGQMPKPDVDLVSGLSPSISISQKSTNQNPRSTVGTITEIYDFLRVLFARVGTGYCPDCETAITAQTRDAIVSRILNLPVENTLWILAAVARSQKGEFRDLFEGLRKQGFTHARVDGQTILLADPPTLERQIRHNIEVVVDRIVPSLRDRGRVTDAVDLALRLGESSLIVSITPQNENATAPVAQDQLFSTAYACPNCGTSFPAPSPPLFSFNSPQGMCTGCDGLGRLYTFIPDLLVSDATLSIKSGAISAIGDWTSMGRYRRHIYKGVADWVDEQFELAPGTMLTKPWSTLPEAAKQFWLWGSDRPLEFTWRGGRKRRKYEGQFGGIIPELVDRYRTTKNKMQLASYEKMMSELDCPDCGGKRLNRQASAVRIVSRSPVVPEPLRNQSLPELCNRSIEDLANFFSDLQLTETDARIASEALKEIRSRLGFLLGVGLDYLTLSRTAPTLSGGESQRIRLAGQIGSGLVGVLYILDEPSIGLHPRDNDRLIETLLRLRDAGNTLVVVEHDEDTLRAADTIVDFGPGPGVKGGRIVASGTLDEIASHSQSVTGQFLSGARSIPIRDNLRLIDPTNQLTIHGATHHNLKRIDVSFPLGTVICVTGVSGSGKSSLVKGILEPILRRELNGGECEAGAHEGISGLELLDKIIAIDQSPIGRTPRSNPGTYVKVFDEIRNLFAKLPDAKARGYTASRFSFNVDGGRCAACDGNGSTKLDMDFLADIWVTCAVCQGKRYNRETLAVRFKGNSIADVLEMDISQALKLFQDITKIAEKLQTLVDVGLEYLHLGQPSTTLSGGEAQRIKLSRELSKRETGRTLYVLDEPTTGLHFADVQLLLNVVQGLADRGNTIVIVEHNLDVIKTADWVIDLGPEGGVGGGLVIAAGRPQEIAKCKQSYTGAALARTLGLKPHKSHKKRHSQLNVPPPRVRTHIIVEGASEHNLKSVDVEIPRDAMTVFCGPSGSGKSSLAMDTIYAEGQRRYVESLSSYARQFINQTQKPRVERIEGLSPAIALEQKNLGHSPRSTVGTVTEIYDFFRILYARLGVMHCPDCAVPVGTQTPDEIVDKVMRLEAGTKALILAPIDVTPGEASLDTWHTLRAAGYARVRINGTTMPLEGASPLDSRRSHQVQVVVDRIVIDEQERTRISDSVEQALSLGVGVLQLAIANPEQEEIAWELVTHSQHLVCGSCGRSFSQLTPHHFSFNSAIGWCPQCDGLGTQTGTNPAALVTALDATLDEGAAILWPSVDQPVSKWMLRAFSRQTGIPTDVPIESLSVSHRRMLFHGTGARWFDVRSDQQPVSQADDAASTPPLFRFQFKGFYPALDEASKLTPSLRGKLSQLVAEIDCSACNGSRLREDSAAVRFRDATIADLVQMPLDRLALTIDSWKLDTRERKIAGELLREIKSRVRFLLDVGLDYITLHRGAATLSGGEAQRIRLAAQLGSGLCGVLYVLDEPTIGLHPRDNARLLGALHRLRDLGNTLLVVEHDRDVIAGSDYLCDFGPRAGRYGGRIVAQGPPQNVQPNAHSVTAGYLTHQRSIPLPYQRRPVVDAQGKMLTHLLTIKGARENNLRGIDVSFPTGALTAVTGPSGSGKSSLVEDILYPALARKLHRAMVKPGRHDSIEGQQYIEKVIRVDQSPLGNSPTSNPATYTGVFDFIRQLFAELPESMARGFTQRAFSFNVTGGRCEACEGSGQRKIEMHFLPDVWIICEECQGQRYRQDVLEVKYHGHSINDVLNLQCGDAIELFADHARITRTLQTLCDVGLDYITLGQSARDLSGGEAQRVKLASELARPGASSTLYLLDEPTTGLHFEDIRRLLTVMQRLVDQGNTMIVIEHNLEVIKSADWIIDIGPGAGVHGGRLVFAGTPEQMAGTVPDKKSRNKMPAPDSATLSSTAAYVKQALELSQPASAPELVATITKTNPQRAQVASSTLRIDPPHTEEIKKRPVFQPWRALGRRWHLLNRGFPANRQPQWPIEMVEPVLLLCEQIAGGQSLIFDKPNRVRVQTSDQRDWADIETKNPEALRLSLNGTAQGLDLDLLQQLGVDGPVAIESREQVRITLQLQCLDQVLDVRLRDFLAHHFAHQAKAIGS